MERKLFSEAQVGISAFLGGPIPPGFLIYKNYRALGKEKQAYTTLGATLVFTVVLFYGLFQIPPEILDRVPNVVFSILYGFLIWVFFKKFMSEEINQAMADGASKGSNWTVAGMTLLGLVITLIIIFGFAATEPMYEGKLIEVNENELYYEEGLITEKDAKKLIAQLQVMDYFGSGYGNVAKLELVNDEYLITLLIDEQFWDDPDILYSLENLNSLMSIEYLKKTKLRIESVSLSGNSKYKYLNE